MEAIIELKESDVSLAEKCSQLGHILGVGRPVSERVLLAALDDDNYARNLLTCRREPALLAHLLDHPPSRKTASLPELLGRVEELADLAGRLAVEARCSR